MEMRNLGNSGLKVSVCGLGTNNFGMRMSEQSDVNAVVHKALDLGVTLFDTADIYGGGRSEEMLSVALGSRRHEVIVATKFGIPMEKGPYAGGASRRYIMEAVDASLRRLNTDYIDLYQQHFPDANTPIEETLSALDSLVQQGKVRYLGNSNFTGWQTAEAHFVAKELGTEPFVSAQNNYSLVTRDIEKDLVPATNKYGLGVLPFFPLAGGALTGKYKRGEAPPEGTRMAGMGKNAGRFLSDRNFDITERLEAFAQECGHTLVDLAFGWLASQPHVPSVIAGATKVGQIEENAKAVEWALSAEELATVDEITR